MRWVQTSKWVDLQEVRPSFRITSQVHAAGITAAENTPCCERDLFCSTDLTVLIGEYKPVLNQLLTTFLIHIRIGVCLGVFPQNNLQSAEWPRVLALAENAYGKLAAGQICLDQHGLLVSCQKLLADGR